MPTYEAPGGRPIYINPAHVILAEPADDIGITRVLLSNAVMVNGQAQGMAYIHVKCPFTNFKVDMEKYERGVRRSLELTK